MGTAYATVRIYAQGQLLFEAIETPLVNSGNSNGDWWDVARIHWPTGRIFAVGEILAQPPREQTPRLTWEAREVGLCGTGD